MKISFKKLSAVAVLLSANLVWAQDVASSWSKGADGCPEIRVQNNRKKPIDALVEYSISQKKSNGQTLGGTKTDPFNDVGPNGRSKTDVTYAFGVACHLPYSFSQRIVSYKER